LKTEDGNPKAIWEAALGLLFWLFMRWRTYHPAHAISQLLIFHFARDALCYLNWGSKI